MLRYTNQSQLTWPPVQVQGEVGRVHADHPAKIFAPLRKYLIMTVVCDLSRLISCGGEPRVGVVMLALGLLRPEQSSWNRELRCRALHTVHSVTRYVVAHEAEGVDGAAGEVGQPVAEQVVVQPSLVPALSVTLAVQEIS